MLSFATEMLSQTKTQVGEELVGADEAKLKERLKEAIQQKLGTS